jgi:hypothetical protein
MYPIEGAGEFVRYEYLHIRMKP